MKLNIYFKFDNWMRPVSYEAFNITWDGEEGVYFFDLYNEEEDLLQSIEVPKSEVMLVDLEY